MISHRTRQYRGHGPDSFAMRLEIDPARSGRTLRWSWSDDPEWNVQVCHDCDFTRGYQCDECRRLVTFHRA